MDTNKSKEELTEKKGGSKKWKSCKGTLYYSSALKSRAYNPFCVGIPSTLPQVSQEFVGETERDASKEVQDLTHFHYACAGYSTYMDRIREDPSQIKTSELPVCVGFELLVGRRIEKKSCAAVPVSAHVHNKEDRVAVPQTQRHQSTHSAGNVFLNKFTRNADLVASGVTKNIRKVGNYIKGSVSDFLFPYSGRSK